VNETEELEWYGTRLVREWDPLRHPLRMKLNLLHLQVKNNEEGLQLLTERSHQFHDVHLCWIGPFYPILRLIHPKFIGPILQASGIYFSKDHCLFSYFCPSSSYPCTGQAGQGRMEPI
jgi:hypothetical protein